MRHYTYLPTCEARAQPRLKRSSSQQLPSAPHVIRLGGRTSASTLHSTTSSSWSYLLISRGQAFPPPELSTRTGQGSLRILRCVAEANPSSFRMTLSQLSTKALEIVASTGVWQKPRKGREEVTISGPERRMCGCSSSCDQAGSRYWSIGSVRRSTLSDLGRVGYASLTASTDVLTGSPVRADPEHPFPLFDTIHSNSAR
jgi:hypothetical protein